MFDVSPVSSNLGASQNPKPDFRQDQSSGSIAPSVESLRKKNTSLRVLHPNTPLPGRWWGSQLQEKNPSGSSRIPKEKKNPFAIKNASLTHLDDESSMDEFFETVNELSLLQQADRFSEYSPLSSALEDFDPEIRPHMTEPLLPDGSPLNFSAIKLCRGETNIYSATPLARVWEFNSDTDKHEYSILNILADEFENLDEDASEPKQSLWSQFRKLTVGLNEDEYNECYPWAKYCIKSLLDGEEDSE
ncbi:hypothetical protein METBIDRAFT_30782 [Metschnikowia bicuspidata var. bicuspidata NRRL YB-4993]|uniref:Uncharacterized protein n=1 Tax=Metschnikowia bicuspidata var. bicuspidata NRRL YB-4993 TaxID=869754 RepID=A0A1A0HKJ1_9ASCO|nr:hypothetical protein METBIDRAFT_30782 [Metschnikowia bicuspidata var. bicuspidata NRRL YB-4993]OBA24545.1 hypothetical protein METBIDRAFT_30782 [Metschnikowia bicuspidata var. bicuspidata NRRL YB-4993]